MCVCEIVRVPIRKQIESKPNERAHREVSVAVRLRVYYYVYVTAVASPAPVLEFGRGP